MGYLCRGQWVLASLVGTYGVFVPRSVVARSASVRFKSEGSSSGGQWVCDSNPRVVVRFKSEGRHLWCICAAVSGCWLRS